MPQSSQPVSRRRVILVVGVLLALTAGAVVLRGWEPSAIPGFPRCPSLLLTGTYCPGCGSGRAVHDLLNLDVAAAFGHNPLFVLLVPFFVAWGGLGIARAMGIPIAWHPAVRPWVGWFAVWMLIVWWILRNLPWNWADIFRP